MRTGRNKKAGVIQLQKTESTEEMRRGKGHRPEDLEEDGRPRVGHRSGGERGTRSSSQTEDVRAQARRTDRRLKI